MPTGLILLLGAFAGLTIYLGLPLAFLKQTPQSLRIFLNMLATGILLFLFFDVISKASEPIGTALDELRTHHAGASMFFLDIFLLMVGIGLGSVGLVSVQRLVLGRLQGRSAPQEVNSQPGELSSGALALLIATGIGLHNFSEGLAIGQSAAVGALQLAVVLIVGFGLHNMTEGFGIAGPLTGQTVSWRFVALLGLIGGGPTFLGTAVGMVFNSEAVFILFLALAAGAIMYVVAELLGVARRFKAPEVMMWGLLLGFLLGYATDLLVTYAGA